MQIQFPTPPSDVRGLTQFVVNLIGTLRTAFNSVVSSKEATPRIILQSPNGSLYAVTVDDAGTLQTAVAPKTGF